MCPRPHELLAAVVSALMLNCAIVAADEVPLDEEDLRQITNQVLAKHPLLSSSPGIKAAVAQRSVRSTDLADVIYYPHTESAGIKSAFQVGCSRQVPDGAWSCDDAEIRRYLALDSQDFDVRITGPIGSTEAMALIEATRTALEPDTSVGSAAPPKIAIMVKQYKDTYLVTWSTSERHVGLAMQARLSAGGDPANPKDWQVSLFEPATGTQQ